MSMRGFDNASGIKRKDTFGKGESMAQDEDGHRAEVRGVLETLC